MQCPNCKVELHGVLGTKDDKLDIILSIKPVRKKLTIKDAELGTYIVHYDEQDESHYLGVDLKLHKVMMEEKTPYLSPAYAKRILAHYREKEAKELA